MDRIAPLVLSAAVFAAACGGAAGVTTSTVPEGAVVASFSTPDGSFRVLLTGAAAEEARVAFASGQQPGIPNGKIMGGDGGINLGHDWHLEEVEFADMATEVCDGTAAYVDSVGYEGWVASQGDRYCPWGAELIGLEG